MKIAVDKGRATRPNLELGICGEHGGDPDVDPQVREDRARLRVLLAVPRPGGPPRGRPGRARDDARQVASASGPRPGRSRSDVQRAAPPGRGERFSRLRGVPVRRGGSRTSARRNDPLDPQPVAVATIRPAGSGRHGSPRPVGESDCETRTGAREQAGRADAGDPGVVPAKVRVPVLAALPRERLEARLGEAFGKRLTLVVAPAGSGKTTLLARFAATSGALVAWYRAESWDADELSFVRHLEAALAGLPCPGLRRRLADRRGGGPRPRGAPPDAAGARPARHRRLLLPRGHAGRGRASGGSWTTRPPWLTLVLATRVAPGLQPVAPPGRGRAARGRHGRPAVPGLGGGAALPRRLPRSRAAGGPRRPRAPHGGLGGRPPALPPGDARPVRGGAAARPGRARAPAAGSCASTWPRT